MLNSPNLVHSPIDRYRVRTQAMGTVNLELGIIARKFEQYGVEL